MAGNVRILLCEFHQETNTFNPIIDDLNSFEAVRSAEGKEMYHICKKLPCAVHGMIDAIEQEGGEVLPAISLYGGSGGKVSDDVLKLFLTKVRESVEKDNNIDGVFVSLHGATCTVSEEDACGYIIEELRKLIGPDKIIAASFDLHANITEKILKNADVVCGYQSYPHIDFYETGYRAGKIGMRKIAGKSSYVASVIIPMMVPPVGYTSQLSPFKEIIEYGKDKIADGTLIDFTVFQVQPWLDIHTIGSAVVAIADSKETAEKQAKILSERLFENRNDYWPNLMTVDEVIDQAEKKKSDEPIILVDAADSPNGGAVGDGVVTALKILERKSPLKVGMFVRDSEAAKKAFEVGIGGEAEFSIGAKYTPNVPGPLIAKAKVRSLHDGDFVQEGPAGKGFTCNIGKTAVLSIGNMDIMVCESPTASGDPQLFRHFGIEPKLYDLIVVKANTSFRVPYSAITDKFCYADTPGAGAANLKAMKWENIPKGFYPFDLDDDYKIEKPMFRCQYNLTV